MLFQNKTSLEAFQLLFMLYQAQSLLTNFAPVSGIFTVVVAPIDEANNEWYTEELFANYCIISIAPAKVTS